MAAKKPRKGGRPAIHDRKKIALTLLTELSKGRLVKDVCRELKVEPGTVRQWAAEDPEFAAVYARAREEQAHAIAEDALTIADDVEEAAESRRIRVDARKWMASKLAPRTYGDRQVVDVNVNIAIAERMKRARERAGR